MLRGIVSNDGKEITRIPMRAGDEYKEGWEVRDLQNKLIWGRRDPFQSNTASVPFKGYGLTAKIESITGNIHQDGIPSYDNPVEVQMVGDRTENLFDESTLKAGYVAENGSITSTSSSVYKTVSTELEKGIYTLSAGNGVKIIRRLYNGVYSASSQALPLTFTFTVDDKQTIYVSIRLDPSADWDNRPIMLNEGIEPLPYEPYGYKIQILPDKQLIYLPTPLAPGEVLKADGTRDIKWAKKQITIESITVYGSSVLGICKFSDTDPAPDTVECTKSRCDRAPYGDSSTIGSFYVNQANIVFVGSGSDSLAILKERYDGATVYYQLATPTTEKLDPLPLIPTTEGANTITIDTKVPPSEVTIKVHARKIHYGFKIDKTVSNSENAVIYTHDAVTMTPAYMDYSADQFNYGSWENSFFVRDCYPVALNLDGTEAYRLDPNDYTKKSDGTPSDIFYELLSEEPSDWSTQWKQYYTKSGNDYTLNTQTAAPEFTADTYYRLTYNESFTGNFMVAFPKVWFYRHEDTQYNYIEISNQKLSDDWKCYAHINEDGQEVDFIYLPIFKGIIKDSKLRSLPGQIPQGSITATTEINAATALGKRWQIWDHSSVECLNDLLTLMSKSIDSQGRFGQGRSSGYNSADTVTYGKLQTGTLVNKGKFHGYNATTKEVKVFGIEGYWSNRFDRLQGMLLVDNVWKIKMTPPYNLIGTDFVTLSDAEVPTGNGYLRKTQTSEYGSIPASIAGGSSSLYYKDYFYKTATGTRVAVRGGACSDGNICGFRCVNVSAAASASRWGIGASPIYK